MVVPDCPSGKEHVFRTTSFECDVTLCGDHAGIVCDNCTIAVDEIHDIYLYQEIQRGYTVAEEDKEI